MEAALPGALTLATDILENGKEWGISFDHIFIDAGTGFMAAALILALSWLRIPSTVHVLLLADDPPAFFRRLNCCREMFSDLMQTSASDPRNFVLYPPLLACSFGKTPRSLFRFIRQLAQDEGFLTDPIYTGKLFMEGKRILSSGEFKGNALIVHSGGALTLAGFQHKLTDLKN